jgi:hypothetical protein
MNANERNMGGLMPSSRNPEPWFVHRKCGVKLKIA